MKHVFLAPEFVQRLVLAQTHQRQQGLTRRIMAAFHSHLGSLLHRTGKKPLQLSALALLLAGLPGCQSIAGGGNTTTGAGSGISELRLIAASPDAPGLDFYLNSNALAYNLGFATYTSYIPLASGSYTVSADTAGSNPPQVLVSSAATLASGFQYTALVGNVNANLQETILQDQSQPAPTGEISFRILDQATRIGAVDIYLIPSTATILTTVPFRTGVTFGTNTGYFNIPAGTYAIAMLPAGTVPIATTLTLYTGPQNTYTAGAVRSIILIDVPVTTTPGANVMIVKDYD